jgi:hypothetical protein
MKRIVEVSDESGLNKSELLLELDFNSNDDEGIAPTLQDPPNFKIAESRGYFERSRPIEPDWFYKKEFKEMNQTHNYSVHVSSKAAVQQR